MASAYSRALVVLVVIVVLGTILVVVVVVVEATDHITVLGTLFM